MKRLIRKIKKATLSKLFTFVRKKRIQTQINMLKNKDVTIISSDCIGGIIYHDFGLEFKSPTINLYMKPSDFIKFCGNLNFYLSQPITKISDSKPFVGRIFDVDLYFVHYDSYEEAVEKWENRKKRVDFDNICFILTCKDGYTKKDIEDFEKLKLKNKIMFTTKGDNKYKSSYYIKNSDDKNTKDIQFLGTKVGFLGKRLIDDFDIVSFLNKSKEV